ncbi:MAG: U32 family peptidase [Bacteroidales bacterium]|nr:U32 family peptidase [Bacteroidales bacterium]
MKLIPVELLSPAKNAEFGKTAIDFGADAVYIGAPKFGARAAARNSIEEIKELCNYAHRFHAKVYVAFNTILFDHELQESEKLIHEIYMAGADALIIQDMGITEMNLPPIELHVSTQGHNVDADHINFLEKIEFSRVILGRELSPGQISAIYNQTDIELEAFVHGALCVSYSGQCYLSANMGGRSGNRGECAQPCRLAWNTLDSDGKLLEKDRPVLSLHDMNRSANLEQLLLAGVRSFKIEGRMKDISYLKNITAYYREQLDDVLKRNPEFGKPSLGECSFDFIPDPLKTFNRGYHAYFPDEDRKNLRAGTSKSLGKPLGEVIEKGVQSITISTSEKIQNGDGLCFFDTSGVLRGFAVQQTKGNTIFLPEDIQIDKGATIYRNNDSAFAKLLARHNSVRKIGIVLELFIIEKGFGLIAEIPYTKYRVEKITAIEKTPARDVEKAYESLIAQLSKTGGTPFYIKSIEVEQGKGFFLPISALNALRRDVLSGLETKLGNHYVRIDRVFEHNDIPYYKSELDFRANISNKLAEKFWQRHGVKVNEPAFEIEVPEGEIPLMETKLCLRYEAGACPKYHPGSRENYPSIIEYEGRRFRLKYQCDLCRMEILPESD